MDMVFAIVGAVLGTAGFVITVTRWSTDERRRATPGVHVSTRAEGEQLRVTFGGVGPMYDVVVSCCVGDGPPAPLADAALVDEEHPLTVVGAFERRDETWFIVDSTDPHGAWNRTRCWVPLPRGSLYEGASPLMTEFGLQFLDSRWTQWWKRHALRRQVGPKGVIRARIPRRERRRLLTAATALPQGTEPQG